MASSRLPKRRHREPKRRAATRRFIGGPWMVGIIIVVALVVVTVVIAASQMTQGGDEADIADIGDIPVEGRLLGDPSAPVKMIELSDYRCPWCGRFARETEAEVRQEYIATGLVQLEFRNMVIEGEPSALAAEAAECANEQGRFWDYHDILFENQQAFDAEVLKGFAADLELDQEAFDECLDSHRHRQLVIAETQEGADAGVQGTPSFFVNGEYVRGYRTFADFRPLIEDALREAGVEVTPQVSEPTPSTPETGEATPSTPDAGEPTPSTPEEG
jgi:protein-disulfide isomerase